MTNLLKKDLDSIVLVQPICDELSCTIRLNTVLSHALHGLDVRVINKIEDFNDLQNKRILFAIAQGISGINLEYFRFLKAMRLNQDLLEGSVAGLIVDGESELYTKSIARDLVFAANQGGCTFPGKPLVEGTVSLQNFNIQAMNLETDNMGAYISSACGLVKRLLDFKQQLKKAPKILMLHASNYETSNTGRLWHMVSEHLNGCEIKEISLRNGSVLDCSGCPYTMCMHFSNKANCYYGGVIVNEVYPALIEADALLLLCPNYNDAVSANLSAFINRLTALFRKTRFYEKNLFAIVVSGYSGGDLVAGQLIGALNMNKSFILPSRFTMLETANDPGSIIKLSGINDRAEAFAKHILETIKK